MIIRPANPDDAQPLSALAQQTYADAFGSSMRADDLRAHLENHLAPEHFSRIVEEDTLLIAEQAGRMIGYVQFGRCDFPEAAGEQDYELRRLYVLSEFQRRGIGAQLMRAALNDAHMKDAPRIFLDVWEHNRSAQSFYERFGFRVIGAKRFEVASGAEMSADLIMCLTH